MKTKSTPILLLLSVAALVMAACGSLSAQAAAPGAPALQAAQEQGRTLSTTGSGTVSIAPDLAYVTIGVRSQDPDARIAVEANSQQTQDVIDALLGLGVDEKDIQTTNFNIYSYEDFNQPFETKPPMVYSVENSVYVIVRDLSGLGDLLATAVDAGANNVWGIQFDVEDKSKAVSDARAQAVAAARASADELATLAGVELGEIVSISSFGGFPQPFAYGVGGGAAAQEAALAVPISPGLLNITVEISIIFAIQ